jgi:cytochrome c biogenesis protein
MTRVWRGLVRGWRTLTSMRTALILLFLLAVAAVPGSLLPQRPLNPDKTNAYITAHGTWGRFLDHIGMYDVFGAPWFAAIYLLLAVSLLGCIVPRTFHHFRAATRKPLPAPRNLDRLPESGSFEVAATPAAYASAARTALGRRWRTAIRDEPSGAVTAVTLSAEKGYSRETGNLIFHIALLISVVLIAVGRLFNYQGSLVLDQGNGFCNSVTEYDSWKPGRFAAEGKISPAPFCITRMTKFTASYSAQGEPLTFSADVTYRRNVDAPEQHTTIQVNHPLRIEGDRVYLIGHGFVPEVTVRMPNGKTVTKSANFVPTNVSTYLSEGVIKFPDFTNANRSIGISGIFAPSPVLDGDVVSSFSPRVDHPVLGVRVYRGNLNDNGLPQSIYTLDTTRMKQIGAKNLTIGKTGSFPGGVTVRFDGWVPWASIQVSHDPAQGWLLWSALAMVVGLVGSLGIRRRRIWLRLTPTAGPQGESLTVVSVGGLARSDSGTFATEFAGLLTRLRTAGEPVQPELILAGRE